MENTNQLITMENFWSINC